MDTYASDRPLHGVKVLDIATLSAGPMAATVLADYGAEVIRIPVNEHGSADLPSAAV